MNSSVQTWWVINSRHFSAKDASKIMPFLEGLGEESTSQLMGIQIKSPLVGFLLTLCLGQLGIGRFYAGSMWRAFLCLLSWIIGGLGWVVIINGEGDAMELGAVMMSALGFGVWMWLLDLYNIMGEIKRSNILQLSVVGFYDKTVKKCMRQDQVCYWILLLVLGGCSIFGFHSMAEQEVAQERGYRQAAQNLERMERDSKRAIQEYERNLQNVQQW